MNTEKASSAPRQPPSTAARGTASTAASAEPTLIPVVYMPVTKAGRSAKRSFAATGSRAPAKPMPIPTPIVRAITADAGGAIARTIPKPAISARQNAIA